MKTKLLWVVPLAGLLVVACGGGSGSPCGPGHDKMPTFIDPDQTLDTFWVGTLGVSELQVVGSGADHNTLVQASFDDMSQYQVQVAERQDFSDACFIYTGKPVIISRCRPQLTAPCSDASPCPDNYGCLDGECYANRTACILDSDCPAGSGLICEQDSLCASRQCTQTADCGGLPGIECQAGAPIPLLVTRVTFDGLASGADVLTPDPTKDNHIKPDVLPLRAFGTGAVKVKVESDGGARSFPAFDDRLDAPEFPVLTAVAGLKTPDLSQGPSLGITADRDQPLRVEWKPSGASYIEVKLLPGAGSTTPYVKMRCITYDDGCLDIPAEALNYLAKDACTNFQFRIERHNAVLHRIMDGSTLKAAAICDIDAELQGTVLR